MKTFLFLVLSLSVALTGSLSLSSNAYAAIPQELVSQLSIANLYSDPKGAVLVIFGYNQALTGNFVFLGDSQNGGHELTQLEFEGGMGQSGQGSDYTRTFKSADQRKGTLFFANEGVYVLSGGRTNFFAVTDKSKYLEMLKANQVKIHLLPTIRQGAYVFKAKDEDYYITLDNSDRGGSALDEFEVYAGKSGALSFVGSGKSKPAGDNSDEVVIDHLGTLALPQGMFVQETFWTKATGEKVKVEVLGMGTSSTDLSIKLGVPASRFTRENMSGPNCNVLLGIPN